MANKSVVTEPSKPGVIVASEDAAVQTATARSDAWETLLAAVTERSVRATERKQDRSKRTEQQILAAALRVFARDGVSRSRIADIAAEAGISTSTLYEYYRSKEDLAYDVPLSYLAAFFQRYRAAVVDKPSARERILLYLSLLTDFVRENAEWARVFYLEIWPSVFVSETDLRHSVDDFARVVVFLVKQGIEEGDWGGNHSPYETAALLLGSVNQVIITWLMYRQPRNLTKAGIGLAERILLMLATETKAETGLARDARRR